MITKFSRNSDLIGLTILSLWTIITRLPFKAHYLFNWDAVQYALALEKYNIAAHQPHPPGYFLYVMLGKLFSLFTNSAVNSYFIAGIFCSIVTLIFLYYLVSDFTGKKRIGLAVSFLFSTNYIFWESGEYPNSYVSEVMGVVILAFFLFRYFSRNKDNKYLYIGSLVLGLIGGFRQNTAAFLLTFFLFIILYKKTPVLKALYALFLCSIGASVWFIPMIIITGGLAKYVSETTTMASFYVSKTSIFTGAGLNALLDNFAKMYRWITIGLNILVFPILWLFYSNIRKSKLAFLKNYKTKFLLSWLGFPVFFYLFFHLSKPGYLFTFLPAVYLILGIAIERIVTSTFYIRQKGYILALSSAFSILSIAFSAIYFYNDGYIPIEKNDKFMQATIAKVRTFKPEDSIIVINQATGNPNPFFSKWRHMMYYLPEYRLYRVGGIDPFFGEINVSYKRSFKILHSKEIPLNANAERILWLTDQKDNLLAQKTDDIQVMNLPLNRRIIAFSIKNHSLNLYQNFVVRKENNTYICKLYP